MYVCPCKSKKDKQRNKPKQEWLLTLKENISFIKILNRKTSTKTKLKKAMMCLILGCINLCGKFKF